MIVQRLILWKNCLVFVRGGRSEKMDMVRIGGKILIE